MNKQEKALRELSNKIIKNRVIIRTTKNMDTKRRLIAENHDIMTELDRRYTK